MVGERLLEEEEEGRMVDLVGEGDAEGARTTVGAGEDEFWRRMKGDCRPVLLSDGLRRVEMGRDCITMSKLSYPWFWDAYIPL